MSVFLLDIAGILELAAFAAGLWLLQLALKQGPGALARLAAWALIVGSLSIGACTLYYGNHYRNLGYFDGPQKMMQGERMGSSMMGSGMMAGGMMGEGEGSSSLKGTPAKEQPSAGEHAAHHPDKNN